MVRFVVVEIGGIYIFRFNDWRWNLLHWCLALRGFLKILKILLMKDEKNIFRVRINHLVGLSNARD
jgi:hypothetical protein